MDFSLNEGQRAWQENSCKFAQEEICQISLRCDQMTDPASALDWEIIKTG
jgi:hypothetical protein